MPRSERRTLGCQVQSAKCQVFAPMREKSAMVSYQRGPHKIALKEGEVVAGNLWLPRAQICQARTNSKGKAKQQTHREKWCYEDSRSTGRAACPQARALSTRPRAEWGYESSPSTSREGPHQRRILRQSGASPMAYPQVKQGRR